MTDDTALEAISPRDLHPMVLHFRDVIVDRAPPVRRRQRVPSPAPSIALHTEPVHQSEQVDEPAETAVDFDEEWFTQATLTAPARLNTPASDLATEVFPDPGYTETQLLVAATVSIASTVALGVALGALVSSAL